MATSEQLERKVDCTRSEIEQTLSQLRDRLRPGLVMDDLVDFARDNGGAEFVRKLGRQVADNPLPVALMGAGLAWLMVAQNRPAAASGQAPSSFNEWAERTDAMTDYDSERQSRMGDSKSDSMSGRASEAMGGARQRASDAMGKARETTSGAYQKVSSSVSSAMDSVSSRMPSTRRITNFMQEEPMVLAGIGVALGAIVGAMLPTTRIEEQYVGPAAGSLKEQAKDAAREQWERGKQMASEGWDEAKEAASRTWEDAKNEAQKSWDGGERRMSDGSAGQTGDMTGTPTPLVPSEQGDRDRMADATSRNSNS
jgi:ElaB/YqjD/DUF883 family membrane-anchored ribosome-binding protein